ncbi:MAG: hypothetical protein N3F05_01585 [Candidatus Diapherotrites archaeon]|nr:hypothetical protein [Candidatus Diapherotrites archaeon]
MAEGIGRFVELVIATTVGSIVGAFISNGIDLSINTFVRALFATCALMIFFFLMWQISKGIGSRKSASERFGDKEKKVIGEPSKFTYEESEEGIGGEIPEEEDYEEDYAESYGEKDYAEEAENENLQNFREKLKKIKKKK